MIRLYDHENHPVEIEMKIWNPYELKPMSEDLSYIFFASQSYIEKFGENQYYVNSVLDCVEMAIDWYNGWEKFIGEAIDSKFKTLYYNFDID